MSNVMKQSTKKKISSFAKKRPRNSNGQFVGMGGGMNTSKQPKHSRNTIGRT